MFKNAAVYSYFIYLLVPAVIMAIAKLTGFVNAIGWAIVNKYVVLLIWFGSTIVKKENQLSMAYISS